MAFDQSTRNRLARFVSDARTLLTEEFTRQLQNEYGLDPENGTVTGLEKLTAQDDTKRETARILRETMEYYLAGKADDKKNRQDVLQRIVREQAFTVLNRLCALRMAESRGLLIESIAKGYQSKGFQLYARLAGTGLGETGDAYSSYLFSLFDEFAVDLAVLFDRFNPQGRLFPRQTTLVKLLDLINDPEIEQLWGEDETIGWMYQYFNTKEERQDMRAASQAPRNSRELAVRNQFFTPRYVVEFLTDNTLGRIWYEMTKGDTSLKDSCHYLVRRPSEIFLKEDKVAPMQAGADEDLSQEELLKQTVYIPHHPLKDPREIKMLDPACGSMHFGLYAFDLFEQIYTEAWGLEETLSKDALWRLADLDSLHDTYQTREDFLRDVPRLIIERNIHGVDIDPRAVQIAGLSLWLRAQKSWHAQGVKPQDRPQIRRSNIVCAEPMPGDRTLLEEFLQTFKEDRLEALMRRVLHIPEGQKVRATKAMAEALANLVRTVWQEMELAGEAGSLLKIEVTLRDTIEKASSASKEKTPLFSVLEFGTDNSSQYNSLGANGNFWSWAESLVLGALLEYSEQTETSEGFRRRLFIEDASQGFAFIDLCHKLYDVVLMNPPFGLPTDEVFSYMEEFYPDTYVDIYGAFVARGVSFARSGAVGAITPRTFIAAKKMARWRENTLVDSLELIADFGLGVMDEAMVRSCAYTLRLPKSNPPLLISYDIRVNNKEHELLQAIKGANRIQHNVDRNFMRRIPGSKILYFITPTLANLLSDGMKIEPNIATVRGGLRTFEDIRYLRLRWEIPASNIGKGKFDFYAKGGEYANYYTNIHLLVNRSNDSKELCETNKLVNGQTAQVRQGLSYYYRRGCQYTTRSKGFSARIIPDGCVMSSNAPMVFSESNIPTEYILGWVNSRLIRAIIEMQSMADDFIPGTLKTLPWIAPSEEILKQISSHTLNLVALYRHLNSFDEIDPYFISPIWSDFPQGILKFHDALSLFIQDIFSTIQGLQEQITILIDEVYAIDSHLLGEDVLNRDVMKEVTFSAPTKSDIGNNLLSYALGCAFGRFNISLKSYSERYPSHSSLFEQIPTCQPGILQNALGLHPNIEDLSPNYPLMISFNGILVDDEGNINDVEKQVRETVSVIWNETSDTFEHEICQILGIQTIREYLRKPSGFFADHLNRYSKSHRQAPIYWPLSTPSNSYTLWLYYHRLNDQTLFTCVNDFVDPKIKQVSEEAKNLRQKKSRSSAEEKELERLTDFEHELKDFRDELLRVAKFWKPNLNDGVQITAAPLWKLFQLKPWQKKLRETWESLEAGEYDWAHLAYSIWPDRVREKCKADKSLAIAHDLEHLYVEPKAPLKKPRKSKQAKAPSFLTEEDE